MAKNEEEKEVRSKKKKRRVGLCAILADPVLRRELMVNTIIATQAREGIVTTRKQAEEAYDKAINNTYLPS